MRQILGIHSAPRQHWVGDGFPVRTMLSHHDQGAHISPFIMLDYAGPAKFTPTIRRGAASARTRTRASRPSPSSMRARSSTATRPALAVSSALATCSG